jgi:hypothetical protein
MATPSPVSQPSNLIPPQQLSQALFCLLRHMTSLVGLPSLAMGIVFFIIAKGSFSVM